MEFVVFFNRAIRSFNAVLGPAGGKRGYQGLTGNFYTYDSYKFQIIFMVFLYVPQDMFRQDLHGILTVI